jgi:hypothetical protein
MSTNEYTKAEQQDISDVLSAVRPKEVAVLASPGGIGRLACAGLNLLTGVSQVILMGHLKLPFGLVLLFSMAATFAIAWFRWKNIGDSEWYAWMNCTRYGTDSGIACLVLLKTTIPPEG